MSHSPPVTIPQSAARITPVSPAELQSCIQQVAAEFPFPGYMEARKHAYHSIAANCIRLLPSGARILDFGAGPCDSTAVLARMGFRCTSVDDLQDEWHGLGLDPWPGSTRLESRLTPFRAATFRSGHRRHRHEMRGIIRTRCGEILSFNALQVA
jgi:hypothetical protein